MNKLIIILLFLPLFADAQIGLLLRPLPTEAASPPDTIPSDITGLVQWLRADTLITTTGSAVDTWGAIVGSDVTDLLSTDPQYSGSGTAAYVEFDGVSDALYCFPCSTNMNLGQGERTVFIVVYTETKDGTPYQMAGNGADGLGETFGLQDDAEIITLGSKRTFTTGDIPTSEWYVMRAEGKDIDVSGTVTIGETYMYINGTASSITSTGTTWTISTGTTDVQILGENGQGNKYFDGRLKEVLVFNKILSSAEISALQNYFTARYSITF